MTILARETFTGGLTSDLEGLTPDGGGDVALQLGTWTPKNNTGLGRIGITADGAEVTAGNVPDNVYTLAGAWTSGTEYDDYVVRARGKFRAIDLAATAWIGVTARWNSDGNGESYTLRLMRQTTGNNARLQWYDEFDLTTGSPSIGAANFAEIADLVAGQEYEIELHMRGGISWVALNGIYVSEMGFFELGLEFLGEPGLSINGADAVLVSWELDDQPQPPAPCVLADTASWAADGFTAGITRPLAPYGLILGTPWFLDGNGVVQLARGSWAHVDPGFGGDFGHLTIQSNRVRYTALKQTGQIEFANIENVFGGPAGDQPLGDDYAISCTFRINEAQFISGAGAALSSFSVLARWQFRDDRTPSSPGSIGPVGYQFRIQPVPNDFYDVPQDGGFDIAILTFFHSIETIIQSNALRYRGGVDLSVPHTARFCIAGAPASMCCFIDDRMVLSITDPYPTPDLRHDSGGSPGIGGWDGYGYTGLGSLPLAGGTWEIEDYKVVAGATNAPVPPTGGSGDPVTTATPHNSWVRRNLGWRPVPNPSPVV